MKLTNAMRDAFVSSALHDVPQEDYAEQISAATLKAFVDALPPKVRAVWNDADLRDYLYVAQVGERGLMATVPDRRSADWGEMRARASTASSELRRQHAAQRVALSGLRDKLRAVAYSVTTRKALAEALPEFEAYLPADEATASRQLPVVANVVADFVRAGWPKGKKVETRTKSKGRADTTTGSAS